MGIWGEVAAVLGWPANGSGVAGGAISAVVLGVPAYLRAARKNAARHAQQLAQSARQHAAVLEQRERHHKEAAAQAEKHNQQQLDRQDVHTAAIQAHVTQQAAAIKSAVAGQAKPPAETAVNLEFTGTPGNSTGPSIKSAVRKRGGGM